MGTCSGKTANVSRGDIQDGGLPSELTLRKKQELQAVLDADSIKLEVGWLLFLCCVFCPLLVCCVCFSLYKKKSYVQQYSIISAVLNSMYDSILPAASNHACSHFPMGAAAVQPWSVLLELLMVHLTYLGYSLLLLLLLLLHVYAARICYSFVTAGRLLLYRMYV